MHVSGLGSKDRMIQNAIHLQYMWILKTMTTTFLMKMVVIIQSHNTTWGILHVFPTLYLIKMIIQSRNTTWGILHVFPTFLPKELSGRDPFSGLHKHIIILCILDINHLTTLQAYHFATVLTAESHLPHSHNNPHLWTNLSVMHTSEPACVNLKMLSMKSSTSWPSSSRKYSATVSPVKATRARAPGGSVIWPYTSDTWTKEDPNTGLHLQHTM